MNSAKYLFDNADKEYKSYLSNCGMFDWQTHEIKINVKRVGIDKYISYESIEHLIYIFGIRSSIPSMNDINIMFYNYGKNLYDTYILHCPFINKDKRYMEFGYVYNILTMYNTTLCKSFYKNHIRMSTDFIDTIKSNYQSELLNLQKTHVIINKEIFSKIGKDNRNIHNSNAKLINSNAKLINSNAKLIKRNKELEDEIKRLHNLLKFNICLKCVSNNSDISTESMSDSE